MNSDKQVLIDILQKISELDKRLEAIETNVKSDVNKIRDENDTIIDLLSNMFLRQIEETEK